FGYVPWIWAQLITFHALYDVRQDGVGIAREANLFALAHHEAVKEFDLRASTFLHAWPDYSPDTCCAGRMSAWPQACASHLNSSTTDQMEPAPCRAGSCRRRTTRSDRSPVTC